MTSIINLNTKVPTFSLDKKHQQYAHKIGKNLNVSTLRNDSTKSNLYREKPIHNFPTHKKNTHIHRKGNKKKHFHQHGIFSGKKGV